MCYSVQQKASVKELSDQFNAQFNSPTLYKVQSLVNGFDFPLLPILKHNQPEIFHFANWGLVPHWAKSKDIQKHTLNAKLETIAEVPSFKNITDQRCILPVTGFYEWKWLDSKGKRKEKYHIKIENESVFGLAGLHSTWVDPGNEQKIESFTLLTTQANAIMAEIHNIKKRMPLIMDIQKAKNWLLQGNIELNHNLATKCIESDGQLNLF
ncbi:SOS response-associated peptidase [Brumimicrobium salinarum]|uniref:Abasic site processing protein n=1 Tax=Brumimicrobium salinarum TaxID=2058658 RepID=A0A2I0QZT1_9FLAO|nr:SOS response-associated peptidase [Brumimicrobium salinarum]PKR79813.1 SOS response-associated peptidase [Brumimicrobium salinarum]